MRLGVAAVGLALAACVPSTAAAQAPAPAPFIVSEYRNGGTATNPQDEFVEVYNKSATPYTVPGGYFLVAVCGNNDTGPLAGPGEVIPPGSYRLAYRGTTTLMWDPYAVGNSGFLSSNGDCQGAVATGLMPFASSQVLVSDSVRAVDSGANSSLNGMMLGEGAPVAHSVEAPANATGQPAVVRRLDANGIPIDTNDNADDFLFLNGDGTGSDGIGVPSPKGRLALIAHDTDTPVTLADPGQPATAAPNQVQVGSGAGSTLFIRRVLTNASGADYTSAVQFRYRSITVEGFNTPSQADLRPVSTSDDGTHLGTMVGGNGALQPPPVQGVNSEAYHAGALPDGASIDLNFGFTVERPGQFEIHAVVEAR